VLYVVATPIGNLEDITFRAVDILKTADLILSEDTRETKKVLDKFSVATPQRSYRDQNHTKVIAEVIELLQQGKNLALVSDSGTPVISDPGYKLVRDVVEAGIKVESIPGASALVAANSISGLPTDKIIFLGFLPKKKNDRIKLLETYGNLDATLTIYESPFRINAFIEEAFSVLGNRKVCIAKDLTKTFENVIRGNLAEIIKGKKLIEKGEYVVLVAKKDI